MHPLDFEPKDGAHSCQLYYIFILFYFSDANYDANKCFRRAGKKHMAQPKD